MTDCNLGFSNKEGNSAASLPWPTAWRSLMAIARVHACRVCVSARMAGTIRGWRIIFSTSPRGIRDRPLRFYGRRCGELAGTRNIAMRLLAPILSSSTWRLRSRRLSVRPSLRRRYMTGHPGKQASTQVIRLAACCCRTSRDGTRRWRCTPSCRGSTRQGRTLMSSRMPGRGFKLASSGSPRTNMMLLWWFGRKACPRLPESRQCPAQNAQFRSIESTALPATETRQNGGSRTHDAGCEVPQIFRTGIH